MVKKCFIITFLIIICIFPVNVKAYQPIKSDIYKQGIYDIENLKEYSTSIELLTDTKTSVLLLDKNKELLAYLKLPYKQKIILNNLGDKATIGIIGTGEVAIIYENN